MVSEVIKTGVVKNVGYVYEKEVKYMIVECVRDTRSRQTVLNAIDMYNKANVNKLPNQIYYHTLENYVICSTYNYSEVAVKKDIFEALEIKEDSDNFIKIKAWSDKNTFLNGSFKIDNNIINGKMDLSIKNDISYSMDIPKKNL